MDIDRNKLLEELEETLKQWSFRNTIAPKAMVLFQAENINKKGIHLRNIIKSIKKEST
jgi:hypothetical protein